MINLDRTYVIVSIIYAYQFAGFKISPIFISIANNFSKHPLYKIKK